MLLFLWLLLGLLPGAAAFTLEHDISACPLTVGSVEYTTIYLSIDNQIFSICFTGFAVLTNDCFWLLNMAGSTITAVTEDAAVEPIENFIRQNSDCRTKLVLLDSNGDPVCSVYMRNFDLVHGITIKEETDFLQKFRVFLQHFGPFEADEDPSSQFSVYTLTITLCRHSGEFYLDGTERCNAAGEYVQCSQGEVTLTQCVKAHFICTVTGPTIISVQNEVTTIQDRCAYTLISDSNFEVLGVFRDRRRPDVMFLENVIILHDATQGEIELGQNGKVQVDGVEETFDSSPVTHHQVTLSTDSTGVTAEMSFGDHTGKVFFDGYTLQLHLEGSSWLAPGTQSQSPIGGLCNDISSDHAAERNEDYGEDCCEETFEGPDDDSLDCNAMTSHCNSLDEAPFSDCHSLIDKDPYITVCKETLCTYPAVDGLKCQFLEAYMRACNQLKSDTVSDSWRAGKSCSAPQPFCQGTSCLSHEFCADGISGGIQCFCRAIFASDYRHNDSLVMPVECKETTAKTTVFGCFLNEADISHTDLHLNSEDCSGEWDAAKKEVTFTFDTADSCDAVITSDSNHVIYKNTIKIADSEEESPFVDRFNCAFLQPDLHSISFRIVDSSVVQYMKYRDWEYTLTLTAYTDDQLANTLTLNTGVKLDQTIWLNLEAEGLDENKIAMVIHDCWATKVPDSTIDPKYYLIREGCPVTEDTTVSVVDNGVGLSTVFSLKMFQFSGSKSNIYLHCRVRMCSLDEEEDCSPDCDSSRRRRSAGYENESSPLISMVWTH